MTTEISQYADQYQRATEEFLRAVADLTQSQLDKSDGQGWNPRQVIHHVADSEAQSYARLRRLVAEPGTQIQGYDEATWGENETLGYKELPIDISLNVIRAVRASSLEIIKRLSPAQLELAGVHTESGAYTVKDWLATYIKHQSEHAAQIKATS